MKRYRQRIFIALAVMSLLMSVGLVTLEIVGGFKAPRQIQRLFGRWGYLCDGSFRLRSQLLLQFMICHESPAPIVGPVLPMGSSPQLDAWMKKYPPYFSVGGGSFSFEYLPMLGTDGTRHATMNGNVVRMMVPYRAVEILLLLLPMLVVILEWPCKRPDPEAKPCAKCGYDLRATPDCCPECGIILLGR